YIWGRLKEGAPTSKAFRNNRLSLVTYNYDSSFHRYLTRVLSAHYPDLHSWPLYLVRAFAEEAVPIVHLHGSLRPKDDEIAESPNRRAFMKADVINEIAGRLKIIHNGLQEMEYVLARTRISEAKYLYLLGFGFHPTNVTRLNLRQIFDHQPPPWLGWG